MSDQFNLLIDRLDTIINLLTVQVSDQQVIIQKENRIMATLQNVIDAINAESSVDDSIIALLDGIVAQLKFAQNSAGGIDPASFDAIVTGIQANTAKVQAAITANTPVTPAAAAATV